ncbi:DUF3613 domain-containing protein [Pseudomonas rubra]|uniref:DUF3613 domain-containing protein n=1 Tax=Pseudomonas rubra TaxID=2942627 RepID=A0ABT5P3Q3_9PSED|nr:DUF3613 domain-containing protein [Pseudomonas rubra]MDD1012908.1 DUF3613 domain-containing protein [Pseudomonas rubra]MDD1038224.1 DUF3613 domain-containing protein [Pseudomonas rubra]MDD1156697.1 DUF3613 domain-containing protein [Pseudomonas rubra]
MHKSLLLLALSALPLTALALEAGPSSKAQQTTEAWLQLQARNLEASKIPQTATPKERDQSMQRWLDSYKYVIPDFYRWEKVSSSNK